MHMDTKIKSKLISVGSFNAFTYVRMNADVISF